MDYLELLGRLHAALKPAVYLEIGVHVGNSLALSRSRSVAIDPEPQPRPEALAGKPWVKLYAETSDDFFRAHDAAATLQGHPLDLVFIDGLHEFAQVVRDLENVERWGHEGTVVVIHDALPEAAWIATRTFNGTTWTGDVWRIVPFLREHRPDLATALFAIDDTGALILTRRNARPAEMAELAAAIDRDFPPDGPEYNRLVEDWLANAPAVSIDEALRGIPITPQLVDHAMETNAWRLGEERWEAGTEQPANPLRIVLREPLRGAHRGRMTLAASGMAILRVRFERETDNGRHSRDIFLGVDDPGALHHELDAVSLHADREAGTLELEWEGALGADEALTAIAMAPVDFELQEVEFAHGMTLDLRRFEAEQILWPRQGTRLAPERFPDRPLVPKNKDGKRDAVVFAWWIPDHPEAHKVAEYYVGLLRYHHADSKIFVGMNHGSDPHWIAKLEASGLDIEVATTRPNIRLTSDAGGFLAALEAFSRYPEAFDLVWFGHTKGSSKGLYYAPNYVLKRFRHDRKFWSRRAEIDCVFEDAKIGLYAQRYGLWYSTDLAAHEGPADIDALQRIYRDTYAPIGLTAWDTFFVLRESIVRRFLEAVGEDYFRIVPGEWGGDVWMFEGGFPSIATMQGFEPYIELDTDGAGDPRDDVTLFRDPRQNSRLAMQELERWRADPFDFRPRGLPRG